MIKCLSCKQSLKLLLSTQLSLDYQLVTKTIDKNFRQSVLIIRHKREMRSHSLIKTILCQLKYAIIRSCRIS